MKHSIENNTLTIVLDRRIDVSNAAKVEEEIFKILSEAPGASVVLDAGNLEYISSAGLRIFLKLKKQLPGTLPLLHVSPDVNEILKATGFTKILDVHPENPDASVGSWATGSNKIDIIVSR